MTDLDRIRTDVVGSLLRPQPWKDARARMEQGSISETDFAKIELDCVRKHVALQESIGLDVVTDGEVGRLNFQDSFGLSVSGYDTGSEGLGHRMGQHERRVACPTSGSPARRSCIAAPL
jgi:5-methyltetrahydropteroyltriglutamate--homocysteine methyltransferase